MKRRCCSCVKGYYDNKDRYVPAGLAQLEKAPRYMTVEVAPELVTKEMRDAVLGFSQGMTSKLDRQKFKREVQQVLEYRCQ